MKKSFLLLLFVTILFAQNHKFEVIKDYFIPSGGNNKSVFYSTYPETGERSPLSTIMLFYFISDNTYEVQEINIMNDQILSFTARIIKVKNDDIIITKCNFVNSLGESRKTYYPARLYLKLPNNKNITEWKYTDQNEENWNYKSEWTTVNVDGQNKKALKVTIKFLDFDIKTFETQYFVKGIGLWKTMLNDKQTYKILDYQEHEPRN